MGGGLMQLVAYGAQDVYLTGNPQITFFKVVYRRHTNFAVESIEQFFNGSANFSRKVTSIISRNGDLITKVYLRTVLPEVVYKGQFENMGYVSFAWVRKVGHALIQEVEVEIGGTRMDRQYGDWMNIWDELSTAVGQRVGYDRMIGDVPALTTPSTLSWDSDNKVLKPSETLYIPLQFWFCRNNGLALPLIALQYHEVKINVTFRPVDQLYVATEAFVKGASDLSLVDASLYVDYVYLDTEERRRFAQVTHEYLIEQLQFTGEESVTNSSHKFKLTYNHPSKGIYWCMKMGNYQGNKFMVYADRNWEEARDAAARKLLLAEHDLDDFGFFNEVVLVEGETTYNDDKRTYEAVNPADPCEEPRYVFDTTATREEFDGTRFIGRLVATQTLLQQGRNADLRSKVSGVIRIFMDVENTGSFYAEVDRVTRNNLTMEDLSVPVAKMSVDNRCPYVQRFDPIVWQHHNCGLLIDGTLNPTSEAQLQLNGHDRFTKRDGTYFNYVQPYQHHSNTPRAGINLYSFALNPEQHQPSGTANFSRIDTTQLNVWFAALGGKMSDVLLDTDNKLMIYTINYNVLRIMSGMAGLAYSN